MVTAKGKMNCPDCGVEMNHHAEKLVDPVSAEEAMRVDPELGAFVDEIHTCPSCGNAIDRRAL